MRRPPSGGRRFFFGAMDFCKNVRGGCDQARLQARTVAQTRPIPIKSFHWVRLYCRVCFDLDGFVQPFTIALPSSTDAARDPNAAPRSRDPMAVNNITSTLGLPAVVVPGGYTPAHNFPIAIQFFGKPFTDKTVIELAYAYEQVSKRRKSPASVPALAGETFDY